MEYSDWGLFCLPGWYYANLLNELFELDYTSKPVLIIYVLCHWLKFAKVVTRIGTSLSRKVFPQVLRDIKQTSISSIITEICGW